MKLTGHAMICFHGSQANSQESSVNGLSVRISMPESLLSPVASVLTVRYPNTVDESCKMAIIIYAETLSGSMVRWD